MWSLLKTSVSLAGSLGGLWNINCATGLMPLIPRKCNSQLSWHCSAEGKSWWRVEPWAVSSQTQLLVGGKDANNHPCSPSLTWVRPTSFSYQAKFLSSPAASGFWLVAFSGLMYKRRGSRTNESFPSCGLFQGPVMVMISLLYHPSRCSSLQVGTSAGLSRLRKSKPNDQPWGLWALGYPALIRLWLLCLPTTVK